MSTRSGFSSAISAIMMIDCGRSGNTFIHSVFDQHPHILTCPRVNYFYSYLFDEFGEENELSSERALDFILTKTKFRLIFSPVMQNSLAGHQLEIIGDNPVSYPAWERALHAFRSLVLAQPFITRRDLVLSAYAAYALSQGRDLASVSYLLLSDAISLRSEHAVFGSITYSGRIRDLVKQDFPEARFLALVRDPRAQFASARHEHLNLLDNMYNLRPGNFLKRLHEAWHGDFNHENFVWPFFLLYLAKSWRTVCRLMDEDPKHFFILRNEDVNLHFVETMRAVSRWLDVDFFAPWADPDWRPTMLGVTWEGSSAYTQRGCYRSNGRLQNDPQTPSGKELARPNKAVTENWRKRMTREEIILVEMLFRQFMHEFDYAPDYPDEEAGAGTLFQPVVRGEVPNLSWITSSKSGKEFFSRLYYALTFLPFYVLIRREFSKLRLKGVFSYPWQGIAKDRKIRP